MDEQIRSRIEVNTVNSQAVIPHLGITLRTLLGACLEVWPEGKPGESRQFAVRYKEKEIAVLNVRKHNQPL